MPVLTLPAGSQNASVRAKALVFEDPRSRELLERIEQVAPSEATVLVTGETGTGKEIVARQLHQLSRRASGPFVAVNCGAFSENLVESELFGHEKGAFTGALGAKAGWFEAAHNGTLFLDEIGDLPVPLQVKLLRVLQEGEVVRVGSRQPIRIDVRLVAATNVDLQEAMYAGHFREDLFYRLNVASIPIPPLRERGGDILPLSEYFLDVYRRRLGVPTVQLTPGAVERLRVHTWPGNIRELENAIHHALLVCRDGRIVAEDIRVSSPFALRPKQSSFDKAAGTPSQPPPPPALGEPTPTTLGRLEAVLVDLFEENLPKLHERVEETLMRAAYRYCDNNQLQTARLLGISRNVVRARLIQHGEINGSLRGGAEPPSTRRLSVTSPGPERLRIGYQKFGQLLLVKALGELDVSLARRGTTVSWEAFPGGLQLVDALQDGTLDLGVVGECPPVFAQAVDAPIVYLAAEASAPEGEAIVVRGDSPLTSVAELRGKTVALNRGANVHYLLIKALEEAGLDAADIEVVFLEPEEAQAAFERGTIDAWGIWEPLLGSVQRTLGARVLRDGRGLARNTTYYVARRELAERHPEVVFEVLASVEKATLYARTHLREAVALLERESGVHPEALKSWLLRVSGAVPLDSATLEAQQELADSLHGMKLVPQAVSVADAQWSYLNAV